jgi:hypothetical protein
LGNLVTFEKGEKQFYEERKDFLDYEALTAFVKNEVSKQKPKELVELDQFSYDFPLGQPHHFQERQRTIYGKGATLRGATLVLTRKNQVAGLEKNSH